MLQSPHLYILSKTCGWEAPFCIYLYMGRHTLDHETGDDELIRRIRQGDQTALATMFDRHRGRLEKMVRLRLDCRLQGRIDPSDVLQEAFVDASSRLVDYARNPEFPLFLWLRFLTTQRLHLLHRQHFGPTRNPVREVSLHAGPLPQADSMSLAQQLLGRLTTPSQGAIRVEMQLRVQDALNAMDPIDREVLALRHFEELTNKETAAVLGLQQTAASNRYVRALKRLKEILSTVPGFPGNQSGPLKGR
jgi:RNA polymerase sigma-70 factor (ECF subfamily)